MTLLEEAFKSRRFLVVGVSLAKRKLFRARKKIPGEGKAKGLSGDIPLLRFLNNLEGCHIFFRCYKLKVLSFETDEYWYLHKSRAYHDACAAQASSL